MLVLNKKSLSRAASWLLTVYTNIHSGNHDGRDVYIQQWRTAIFLLVIRVTTGGFHVKYHCLISEYTPLRVFLN